MVRKREKNLSIWLAKGEGILKGEWGMGMKLSAEGNLPKCTRNISRHYKCLSGNEKDRN